MEAAITGAIGFVASAIAIMEYSKNILKKKRKEKIEDKKQEQIKKRIIELRDATRELRMIAIFPGPPDQQELRKAAERIGRCGKELNSLILDISEKEPKNEWESMKWYKQPKYVEPEWGGEAAYNPHKYDKPLGSLASSLFLLDKKIEEGLKLLQNS